MASATQLSTGFDLVIATEAMQKLMRMAERVSRSGATVLITGETGSGKELIARAIHHYSSRSAQPLIDLNCAALPENLVESELFGYEKGAFSGANSAKPGLFELADKGTLFLDEIGELEPKIQVKLLRVLDRVPYYRLGGSRKITVDVRIVAATNQDMESAVRSGRFRADLFHRLSQFQLKVPPLRDRPEDIIAIAEYFLRQHNPEARFSADALEALQRCSWPGNVRELRNVVLQAATLAETPLITAAELGVLPVAQTPPTPRQTLAGGLDDLERLAIEDALQRTGGHQGHAAEKLGISPRTLSRKLKQYRMEGSPRTTALGQMCPEEYRHFRAYVEGTVFIRTESGNELQASLVNVSGHGLAVQGILNPFACTGMLQVRFALPGCTFEINAKGRMAWADPQGKAGIHLTDMSPETERELARWLAQKQQEEGWASQPTP